MTISEEEGDVDLQVMIISFLFTIQRHEKTFGSFSFTYGSKKEN